MTKGQGLQMTLKLTELHHTQKMQLLQESDWANDFNVLQMDQLANYFKSYSVESGTMLLSEGGPNTMLCLLCSGQVDVVKEDSAGKKKCVQTLGRGKIFGELSFFDGGLCSASIIAKNTSEIVVMHRDSFSRLCSDYPQIALAMAFNLIKSMGQRIRQTTGQLVDLWNV